MYGSVICTYAVFAPPGMVLPVQKEPVRSVPVEMTSQGAQVNGLDARARISAGYACHLCGGKAPAFIAPVYKQQEDISAPVKNITDGTTIGFRYLQFGNRTPESVTVRMTASRKATVRVRLDTYDGKEIACFIAEPGTQEFTAPVKGAGIGRHAVYFAFSMDREEPAAEMDFFTFD